MLVLRRSLNDGLRWVAWQSEAPPWYRRAGMPAPDFVGLGHGTHHMRCDGALVEQLASLSAWGTFSSLPAAAHKAQAVKAVLEILAQMAKE